MAVTSPEPTSPLDIYDEALALGGSTLQAQIAAALGSGIESGIGGGYGAPQSAELAGGIGPAEGLFQFEPGTWTGGGKSGAGGPFTSVPTVGQASWQEQVQAFLNATSGGYFGDWGPDLGYPGYGSKGGPLPGSAVASKIASENYSGGYTGTAGTGSAAASTGSSSSTTPPASGTTITLTGVGAILQRLDLLLNPSGGSFIQQVTTLGSSDLVAAIQMIAVRGFFAAGFIAMFYLGVKTITSPGGSSSGPSVLDVVNQERDRSVTAERLDQGNRRLSIQEGEANTRQARESRIATGKTRSSEIKKTQTAAAAAADEATTSAAGVVGTISTDLAEAALV